MEYTQGHLTVSERVHPTALRTLKPTAFRPFGAFYQRTEAHVNARAPKSQESRALEVPLVETSAMPDLEITCAECGNTFPFSEREQEYYKERNLTHPKRCKPCRDARRSSFGGSRGPGGERQRFEITCDQCGKTDTVPFKPSSGRPVLCSDCFSANRATQQRV